MDDDCMITYEGPPILDLPPPMNKEKNKTSRRKRNEDERAPPVNDTSSRSPSSAGVMGEDVRAALLLAPFFVQQDAMEEQAEAPSDFSVYAMFPSLGLPIPQDIPPAKVMDEYTEKLSQEPPAEEVEEDGEAPLAGGSDPQEPPAEGVEKDDVAPLAGGSDEDLSPVEWMGEDVIEEEVETSYTPPDPSSFYEEKKDESPCATGPFQRPSFAEVRLRSIHKV